ncbi:MAG: hypothetical protein AAF297_10625 [Planctomycetota bacterium]
MISFTFLNSLGTGAVTNGLFFLTAVGFGFGASQNFLLGVLVGAVYIVGALAASPMVRVLAAPRRPTRGSNRTKPTASARAVVITIMLAAAAVCALPWIIAERSPADLPPDWVAWMFAAIYLPLTGLLWPIVESYLSGGRSGKALRAATGRFNVAWSIALVIALWAMAPLLEHDTLIVLLGLGVVHVIAVPVAWAMGRAPGRHIAEHHETVPQSYPALLRVFRILLPMSYIVLAALAPFLPVALDRLDLPIAWQPIAASTWMGARVVVFFVFERWHGWQGDRRIPAIASITLIGGFAAVILGPVIPGGLAVLIAGLAVLGAAQAVVYLGALYYALEVGEGEVNAGGRHEALIGVGYTVGPGIGLAISLVVGSSSPAFTPLFLLSVSLIAVGVTWAGFRAGRAVSRDCDL